MKSFTAKMVSLVGLVFLWAGAGYAQQNMLTANVPFEFSVGKKVLPAGTYQVVRTAPSTLAVRDLEGRRLVTVVTGPAVSWDEKGTPRLVFELTNGRYTLSLVWPGNAYTGHQLWVPRPLKMVAQNQAAAASSGAVSER